MEWECANIRVTQRLGIALGASTNRYDTLRIEYVLENRDKTPHHVGLRIMLDTLIGDNDGVPFSVPGRQGIIDRAVELQGKDIPDFIQVLEKPDLTNPGVVVNVTLRGGEATPPERVLITGWPGGEAHWDYLASVGGVGAPLSRGGEAAPGGDSAIGLFYPINLLQPGERRQIVALYGLGAISSVVSKNPSLGLSISSNRVDEGASFWIVARVSNPRAGQRVRLQLPAALTLVEGDLAQTIAPEATANFTTRSWLVRAVAPGSGAEIQVVLEPDNIREQQTVVIVARPTPTATRTLTPSATPSITPSVTPTVTRSATPSATPTPPPTTGGVTR
jgi:predicted secreted protein